MLLPTLSLMGVPLVTNHLNIKDPGKGDYQKGVQSEGYPDTSLRGQAVE